MSAYKPFKEMTDEQIEKFHFVNFQLNALLKAACPTSPSVKYTVDYDNSERVVVKYNNSKVPYGVGIDVAGDTLIELLKNVVRHI